MPGVEPTVTRNSGCGKVGRQVEGGRGQHSDLDAVVDGGQVARTDHWRKEGGVMSVNITIKGRVAFPSNFIGAVDLDGRDVTVEIESVSQDDIQTERGKASKIVIRFKGKQKAFICNKTNAKMIASVLG